jgi:hypothetical protein
VRCPGVESLGAWLLVGGVVGDLASCCGNEAPPRGFFFHPLRRSSHAVNAMQHASHEGGCPDLDAVVVHSFAHRLRTQFRRSRLPHSRRLGELKKEQSTGTAQGCVFPRCICCWCSITHRRTLLPRFVAGHLPPLGMHLMTCSWCPAPSMPPLLGVAFWPSLFAAGCLSSLHGIPPPSY